MVSSGNDDAPTFDRLVRSPREFIGEKRSVVILAREACAVSDRTQFIVWWTNSGGLVVSCRRGMNIF